MVVYMTVLQELVLIILQSFCQGRKKNASLVICVSVLLMTQKPRCPYSMEQVMLIQ